jgi:hypothetical protein
MGLRKDAHGFKAQGMGAHVIFSKIIEGGVNILLKCQG